MSVSVLPRCMHVYRVYDWCPKRQRWGGGESREGERKETEVARDGGGGSTDMGVVDIIDTVERSLLSFPEWEGWGLGWDVSLATRRWVSLHIHLLESSRTPALLSPLTNISRQLPRVPPSPIPISLWGGGASHSLVLRSLGFPHASAPKF